MSLISHKCQYALRAVFELAKRQGQGPTKISHIASAQDIPQRFLENILHQLKQAGIVDSRRGKEGGYFLVAGKHDLTVGQVISVINGPLAVVDCKSGRECSFGTDCVFWPMWEEARNALQDVYDNTTFHDLVERERRQVGTKAPMYSI